MKIGIAMLARDMASVIPAAIRSVSWADGIYLYDDGSSDMTAEAACRVANVPIIVERSNHRIPAFKRGEAEVRNYIIDSAFDALSCDLLVSLDADELLSSTVRPILHDIWPHGCYDAVCLSTWHLFDERRYLHVYERVCNGILMVDPHTRIVPSGVHFQNTFEDGSHPSIPSSERTLMLDGPFHFHLKYYHQSPFFNYSLHFLPKRITEAAAWPYLRELPFEMPADIRDIIQSISWETMAPQDTVHY
jgi:hypothetical protein